MHSATKGLPFYVLGNSTEDIKKSILEHLKFSLARDTHTATPHEWMLATSMAIRDRVMERFIDTMALQNDSRAKRVYYLSLEYLMGRLMRNNLVNLGIEDVTKKALESLGQNLSEIEEYEVDMGLGNGGLGRLAACFMDSLATLDYPAVGYGIYYEFGLFEQKFANGWQQECPENWLKLSNPWVVSRKDQMAKVNFYGHVTQRVDEKGRSHFKWEGTQTIHGVPHDIPIVGYETSTVNFLRLWESKSDSQFDLEAFNNGGYMNAVCQKISGEVITKVLYPNDSSESGKELRLKQQYFFVACSLQDILRRFRRMHLPWEAFPAHATLQLNDTHPAVAVAELMRIFLDEEEMPWEQAWGLVSKVFNYTNHTLLPEALEKWSVPLFGRLLPRHLQIIYEINRRFLEQVTARWPGDTGKLGSLSLIEEGATQYVRMAHLATVASVAVNGVAALHTKLLKEKLFHDFNELWPDKIQNKTNGITPRRWLKGCNPGLSALIDKAVGDDWPACIDKLSKLEKYASDKIFQEEFAQVKLANKEALAEIILKECGIAVDPHALFDVQIKRLHEYKRQHLNLLHIVSLYQKILADPAFDMVPRVFVFGAKAAPGYYMAKEIIHAINAVGDVINRDPRVKGRIKVAFIPNYSVSLAEKIVPGADLSEQISTAGKEASGTGNMKLAINGALTLGTLDGANVEILEQVGKENIFIFGMTVEEVAALWARGYRPYDFYDRFPALREALDAMGSGIFTPGDPQGLSPLVNNLLQADPFMVLADFEAYAKAQAEVDAAYRDTSGWRRKAILNVARMGFFSSDRTIKQYAEEIWKVKPLRVRAV
jgi:glycogen phosphorylase